MVLAGRINGYRTAVRRLLADGISCQDDECRPSVHSALQKAKASFGRAKFALQTVSTA